MPMGLTNAPAIFMQTVNNLFVDLLDNRVLIFLDDMLIHSIMEEQNFKLLEKVFAHLHKYELY